MSDNPFAERDDDRTVFRPMPGGQRAAARAAAPPVAPPPEPAPARAEPPSVPQSADLLAMSGAFTEPLLAAAAPLLQLLARLRNTASPPDQGDMRDRTAREMREFERRARDAGVAMDQVRPAHYAICAALDDVVLATPWGAHGRWSQRTLTATFHGDQQGGAGFFDQLRLFRTEPAKHLAVLQVMYICMALGFMGPFRGAADGAERMERIREQTYGLISGQVHPPAALAENWEGVDAPYRPKRTRFPVWVAFCIALAAAAGGFVWLLNGLNAGSDAVLEAALAAPPAAMPKIARPAFVQPPPPPPEPPPPGPADHLRAALATDIAARSVAVVATPSATILRIPAAKLFPQPNATLPPALTPLLDRIGQALKAEPGPVRILAYTDNAPFRTVAFPSNFALSNARAQAVRAALAKSTGQPARLSADGRADADPVAPNTSAEGREQNRRIDLVLQRSR